MLVTLNEVLPNARRGGYAVGAFNVYNLETAKAVLDAAIEERSPVILGTSEKALDYAGLEILAALLLEMAERASVPVVVHLDHGRDPEIIKRCLACGYSSVMFDSSSLGDGERIAFTKSIVRLAHSHRASVEGERDSIGGREDYIQGNMSNYTDPDKAIQFVEKSGIDAFAVSIGNIHGQPLPDETLDLELLSRISETIDIPLVLHGASSTPANVIKRAVAAGITKINIDTDLRQAFMGAVHLAIEENPELSDPRELLSEVQKDIKRVVRAKMQLFGSSGRVHAQG